MKKFLIALALVGIVDAVSFMVVSPSIVFYVLANGGTKEQYGIILSAFSFASFCTKPVLGWWSDRVGFRLPYVASQTVATLGGVLYLVAGTFPSDGDHNSSVRAILASRLMSGVGAANSALGFAYCARTLSHAEQTPTNSLLSAMRILGMAAGPGFNIFLGKVDATLFGGALKLDPLNSVGLILVASNLIAMAAILLLLDEPDDKKTSGSAGQHESCDASNYENGCDAEEEGLHSESSCPKNKKYSAISSFFSVEILVPFLSIFTFNAAFQLIETGLAPASSHALGWGPIAISTVLGSLSIVIAVAMVAVAQLSSKLKVSDPKLLMSGLLGGMVSYSAVWDLWKMDAPSWHFWVPIFASATCFPFMGVPTRSIFTVTVDSKPALADYHGTMQALLSMGASVAGFLTPGLVASFCLRNPEAVEASADRRELTPWALCAPALFLLTVLGVIYVDYDSLLREFHEKKEKEVTEEIFAPAEGDVGGQEGTNETTPLVRSPRPSVTDKFDPKIAVHRSSCCQVMGITQPSTHGCDEDTEALKPASPTNSV